MATFNVSKKWIIIAPSGGSCPKKAVADLSRCIGLLAGDKAAKEPQVLTDADDSASAEAVVVLNSENGDPWRSGFKWRAGNDRVEIFGESERGLRNGIYSFLSALGISWPAPGQEKLPAHKQPGPSAGLPLSVASVNEPSRPESVNPAAAPLRRFIPAGKDELRDALKDCEALAAWAARNRYDALVFPLAAFASVGTAGKLNQLKQLGPEYGISLEAGGWDLSSLVPRKYFFFQRDCFRMEGGVRKMEHHFCPTSPGALKIIGKAGRKLLQAAAGVDVFHLWPDKGAETQWCSCPTCRAFSSQEQYRIGVNAAADVLASINPNISVTYLEKQGDAGKISLRKNIFKLESDVS